jgi:hypothetical protein
MSSSVSYSLRCAVLSQVRMQSRQRSKPRSVWPQKPMLNKPRKTQLSNLCAVLQAMILKVTIGWTAEPSFDAVSVGIAIEPRIGSAACVE